MKKLLFKIFLTISVLECIYLFALPFAIEKLVSKDFFIEILEKNTNISANIESLRIKTNVKPSVTISANKISAINKVSNSALLSADYVNIEISLLPLIIKKLEPKYLIAHNLQVYAAENPDGSFSFDNLFFKKSNSPFKIKLNNFQLLTDGSINTFNDKADFDINFTCSLPKTIKNFSNESIEGSALFYNINLKNISPLLKKIFPQIKNTSGNIDFLQISADKQNNNLTQFVLNTRFNDVIYNQNNWKNFIYAKNENRVNTTLTLVNKVIDIKKFAYIADGIDIKGNGQIELKKNPLLNVNIEVNNSKAENIASILPPNLNKETMVVEKIKRYGIFGDIEGSVNIKGQIPRPNLKGFAKGRNVHILDKSIHNQHKGTVDLHFDKSRLFMDILIELPKGQNVKVDGYTYLFRDGINDVKVKSTKNIDLPLAQKLILPISDTFMMQLGPVVDMNITRGTGNFDLKVNSLLEFINIFGNMNFDKADFTYNGLFGNITDAKGRLDFDKDIINIKSDRVFIQNNPAQVSAIVKINDNLDVSASSKNSKVSDMLEIINKSELLKEVKKGLTLFEKAEGRADLEFNIKSDIVGVPYGAPPLPPEEAFINMRTKGNVKFYDSECYLVGFRIPLNKVEGRVDFTEKTVNFSDIKAKSGTSQILISGDILTDLKTKIPDVDVTIRGNSIKAGDSIKFLAESDFNRYPDVSFLYDLKSTHDLYLKYRAKSVDFLPQKVYAVMNAENSTNSESVKIQNGKMTVENNNVTVNDLKTDILGSIIKIDGIVNDIDKEIPIFNLDIISDKFNLETLKSERLDFISDKLKDFRKIISDVKGYADINAKIEKNKLTSKTQFNDLSFKYGEIPVMTDNFGIKIENDKLSADNITADIANIPVYTDFTIQNLYNNPYIDAYVTTKIENDFLQKYVLKDLSNKISVEGEINASAKIKGTKDDVNINSQITFYPEADALIYGIRLGDSADKRVFNTDIQFNNNNINIKSLDYLKYITTQNNTIYPALIARGNAMLKNNSELISGYIKTEKTLSAKLLNAFFEKPFFRQGNISCDLKYEDNKILGEMDAKNIDIPIVDTVIKDIKLDADSEEINLKLLGFINDSVVHAKSTLKNDLKNKADIDNIELDVDKIDLSKFLKSISNINSEIRNKGKEKNLNIAKIKRGKLNINSLNFKNFEAQNIESKFSIDENSNMRFNDINIDIEQGFASGDVVYNIDKNEITSMLDFKNVDANYITANIFEAKNQIYGSANANFLVKTKGNSDEELLRNLSGFVYFDIKDGKMPKLGSLEYLLRASNIVKGGVTGFTINHILEILNLVKTGHFSNINGNFQIEQGIAKNIEIYSQGENLSLYISGYYDILTSTADMEILGKVSDKISTIFGPVGNTSLNTFFKYIPGISLLDFGKKDFILNIEKIPPFTSEYDEGRIFRAIINGDINSSGYVESFKWIKL